MTHIEVFHSNAWTERLRRLPGLLVANVGVAHGGADILVAEELLDFTQILTALPSEALGYQVKTHDGKRMAQVIPYDDPEVLESKEAKNAM